MLYSAQQVDARITEMANEIVHRYSSKDVVFVSLLNGAAPFASKLMFAIQKCDPKFHPNAQSMIVSRYGASREPGKLRVVTDLPPEYRELNGRTAVVIDDLIDAGGTTDFARQHLIGYGASEVDLIVLVKKDKQLAIDRLVTMFAFLRLMNG
jgi:hypoxanthine phosphoribosyltransferase